jgi:hypothetical protein
MPLAASWLSKVGIFDELFTTCLEYFHIKGMPEGRSSLYKSLVSVLNTRDHAHALSRE